MSKERERVGWKLDDEYTLYFASTSCTLEYKSLEAYPKNVKGKMMEVHSKNESFYGTLYQALQGYMHKRLTCDLYADFSADSLGVQVKSIVERIDSAMEEIEDKYKIVKMTKG